MILEITVNNWDKYQPGRKDQKTYTWLRLHNDIFDDIKFLELSVKQRMIFIFFLTVSSKKNSKTFNFSPKYDQKRLKLSQKCFISEINVLENQGFITVSRNVSVPLYKNRIDKNRIDNSQTRKIKPNPSEPKEPSAPVGRLWKKYLEVCQNRLPVKPRLSPKLKIQLSNFWHKESDWDSWVKLFENMNITDWHWGLNNRNRKFTLNWVLKNEDNFSKTWNGDYLDVKPEIHKPEPVEYLKLPDEL